jgi:hypothetical protein
MYYISPTSTQLSVLASDLALVISRYFLHYMARPHSEPSSISGGKIQMIEIQESVSQDYKDTAELLGKMKKLVQTISQVSNAKICETIAAEKWHGTVLIHSFQWLDVSEFLINLAWREILLFLEVAKDHLVSGDINRQLLDNLSKMWDVTSRALSSKYIRSKPKSMMKVLKFPNESKVGFCL